MCVGTLSFGRTPYSGMKAAQSVIHEAPGVKKKHLPGTKEGGQDGR